MADLDAPTLLMATRAGKPEHTPEAEPVLVARTSTEAILVLDDGEELRFDRAELCKALEDAAISDDRRPRSTDDGRPAMP